ncbi:MAG TPA: methyltransferase domain-containing protein [Thermoleophilaceae bacterium]|nr:methyltransferase domain-containing protein [Thermoleophilaceae bacterium]
MATKEYRQAGLEIWEAMAAGWDRRRDWMWGATRAAGEWMADALDPKPGHTVLELACGVGDTGFAAAAALGNDGRLIATDFAGEMVEAARRRAEELGVTNAEFRVMDAERMDLDDDSVDGVLCRWGYMLMADIPAALEETRRVLRPGGRLAMSVWGTPDRNPWASVPGRVIREHTGAPPPDPTAPGIFAMGKPERTRELLESAGFEVQRLELVEVKYWFESADEHWTFVRELAGALAVLIRDMPPDEQEQVREELLAAIAPFEEDGGYRMPGAALNALAV